MLSSWDVGKSGFMDSVVGKEERAGKAKKLLEQMHDLMRLRHYSYRTERSYCHWVERFIRFHAGRPLDGVGGATAEGASP